jgi:hypothetical protein
LGGLEALKAGFGWINRKLYKHFWRNLPVRYVLGDGDFGIRSPYHFREYLSKYNTENGINLLKKNIGTRHGRFFL